MRKNKTAEKIRALAKDYEKNTCTENDCRFSCIALSNIDKDQKRLRQRYEQIFYEENINDLAAWLRPQFRYYNNNISATLQEMTDMRVMMLCFFAAVLEAEE